MMQWVLAGLIIIMTAWQVWVDDLNAVGNSKD
jgi:hypothetical protein